MTERKPKGTARGIYNSERHKQKMDRVAEVVSLRDNGMRKESIAKRLGIALSTVEDYLSLRIDLDTFKPKPPPNARKCLRCGCSFKPRAFGIFSCNSCNDFARGVMT